MPEKHGPQHVARRRRVISAAIAGGRIEKTDAVAWRRRFNSDPAGTAAMLEAAPVAQAPVPDPADMADAAFAQLFPHLVS